MAECPFCGSSASEDLITYGGTCPKCFAEIPGEEAPTDPGAEVRAVQERRDRRRATFRAALGLAAMLAIVGCAGVTALTVVLWPEPEVAEMLDFDTLDFPMPEIVATDDRPDAGGTQVAVAAPQPGTAPKAGSSGGSRPTSSGGASGAEKFAKGGSPIADGGASAADLGGDGVASTEGPRGLRTGTGPAAPDMNLAGPTSSQRAGIADLSLEAPKVRRDDNLVLDDPDAIRDMIGEYMVQYIPALNVCYDRRLKVVPSLKGRWLLNFTVTTSGKVKAASVKAEDGGDPELEQCLVEHIEDNWKFGKISRDQPVRRTLRFQPR